MLGHKVCPAKKLLYGNLDEPFWGHVHGTPLNLTTSIHSTNVGKRTRSKRFTTSE
jgi:hypothetical protein